MPGEGPASMTSLDDTLKAVDAGPSPGMTVAAVGSTGE
jgi:hypothetical protein